MATVLTRVCVFCGSSFGRREVYRETAQQVGRLLAERRIGLVYGGSNVGLMGAMTDACLAAGGDVIGVIPQNLVDREVAHRGLPDLRIVQTMHERKALMADLADGFLALPGGFGTLDELCEILTWAQLGIQRKPVGLLNIAGFFDALLALLDHSVEEGFLRPAHRELLISDDNETRLLDRMAQSTPPDLPKWVDRPDR